MCHSLYKKKYAYICSFVRKKKRQDKLEINEIGHLQGVGGNRTGEGGYGKIKQIREMSPENALSYNFDS